MPGHGPITDKRGVESVKGYLQYIEKETRTRFDAGLSETAAANDIALGDYSAWGDAERIVVNVNTLYREFSGKTAAPSFADLFGNMAAWAKRHPPAA